MDNVFTATHFIYLMALQQFAQDYEHEDNPERPRKICKKI